MAVPKPIVFTRHARQRLVERGATEQEVRQAILEAPWLAVDAGRWAAPKWYAFRQEHEGTFYVGKDVRPVFVDEPSASWS